MEQTKDLTSLLVTELIETLKAHEKRVSSRNLSMNEGAFNVLREREVVKRDNKGKKWCGFCKKENHTESTCWRKPKEGDHMTKEVKYFITLDQGIKVPIKVGNGQCVMTERKGNIQVMKSQGEKIIKEVLLVPGLARNLLSVSRFEDLRRRRGVTPRYD